MTSEVGTTILDASRKPLQDENFKASFWPFAAAGGVLVGFGFLGGVAMGGGIPKSGLEHERCVVGIFLFLFTHDNQSKSCVANGSSCVRDFDVDCDSWWNSWCFGCEANAWRQERRRIRFTDARTSGGKIRTNGEGCVPRSIFFFVFARCMKRI